MHAPLSPFSGTFEVCMFVILLVFHRSLSLCSLFLILFIFALSILHINGVVFKFDDSPYSDILHGATSQVLLTAITIAFIILYFNGPAPSLLMKGWAYSFVPSEASSH